METLQPKKHVINALYDRDFDFNCFGRRPVGSYMLATVPRSGSTYCAIKLWQTGLLGAPMEYLNFRIMGALFNRLGYRMDNETSLPPDQVRRYWRDVQRLRTSPNGVFGYKMFTSLYMDISRRAPAFLEEITPNYVIYLTRRDVVGQAISYSRAQRSRAWFGDVAEALDVDYDFEHIQSCVQGIEGQKSSWERVFELTSTSPVRIYYEDLLEDDTVVSSQVLDALGIKPDPTQRIDIPMIKRQRDETTNVWRHRYLAEAARGIPESA